MNLIYPERVRIERIDINDTLFTLQLQCHRDDNEALVDQFNRMGFDVPARSPDSITFRYDNRLSTRIMQALGWR
jgi:hypothetical protein